MRKFNWIFLGVFIAAVAIWLMGGNEIPDPRKLNWSKYTDMQNGFRILLPPKWSVITGSFEGFSGIKFYPKDTFPDDLAGFIYGHVLARHMNDEMAAAVEFVPESMLVDLTRGAWMEDVKFQKRTGDFQGRKAEMYLLNGESSYGGQQLQASAVFFREGISAYLMFFTATEETWPEVRDSYILIQDSFRFE